MYIEFRKMVMSLKRPYTWDSKRDRYKEQTFELREKARLGWFERIVLKHVYYHISDRSASKFDAWDRVLRAGALGQPRGMGWDGEGGRRGVQNGNTGSHGEHPWLIHVIGQKPPQYCKVISLQLK